MDRMLYVAMSNARQMFHAQHMASNNLANASTTGFKRDLDSVRAMPLYGPGLPTRVFAMTERSGTDLSSGAMQETGNPLDLALDENGWFAVIAPDGTEAYTRAGNFRLTANGLLTTQEGLPVLGEGGPVAIPQSSDIVFGTDGTVSVRPLGQESNALAQVDRLRLVRPDPSMLEKGADGLFRMRDGSTAPLDAEVTVMQGVLEGSNVNVVEEMISMMNYQRQYELAVKAMNTANETATASAQLMRMG